MVCRDHLTLIAFDDRHQHFRRIKEIAPHLTIRDGMRPLPRTALRIASRALVELSLAVARHVVLLEQWIQGGPTKEKWRGPPGDQIPARRNSDPSGVTPSFTHYMPGFCVTQSPLGSTAALVRGNSLVAKSAISIK